MQKIRNQNLTRPEQQNLKGDDIRLVPFKFWRKIIFNLNSMPSQIIVQIWGKNKWVFRHAKNPDNLTTAAVWDDPLKPSYKTSVFCTGRTDFVSQILCPRKNWHTILLFASSSPYNRFYLLQYLLKQYWWVLFDYTILWVRLIG